jgi:hypothetical protein
VSHGQGGEGRNKQMMHREKSPHAMCAELPGDLA